MPEHEGHEHDTDCRTCPCCHEVTPSPGQHVCHDMAWERFLANLPPIEPEEQP